jgi:hypothetical protein
MRAEQLVLEVLKRPITSELSWLEWRSHDVTASFSALTGDHPFLSPVASQDRRACLRARKRGDEARPKARKTRAGNGDLGSSGVARHGVRAAFVRMARRRERPVGLKISSLPAVSLTPSTSHHAQEPGAR